ncbi:MAG: glycosyltransferase family 4 protein [Pirellulaceae bacterium]
MRVLVLCEYPSLNGGEHSLLEVAKCFDRQRVEWIFAAPATGPLAVALQRGGWSHVPWLCANAQGQRPPQAVLRTQLAELVARHRPDLVHANSVSMSRLAGPVVRELNVPSLGHLRDIVKLSKRACADLACHDRLLAVSAATRDWYQSSGVIQTDVRVEYNGVDLVRFCPRSPSGYLHAELGLDCNLRLIGTIGQIGQRKGTDVFLAAMSCVAEQVADVHFLLVGQRYSQKDEACAFEERVRRASVSGALRGRVHWLGVRDDIDGLLNELTLYVHAARQEPLGRVLLESAAAGLAVVATDVGGTREIFLAGVEPSALLVPAEKADSLAESVRQLLDCPALRRELGRTARQRAEAAFDVRQTARRLESHYFEVAGARIRPRSET